MSMWSYPDGSSFGGVKVQGRTVRRAVPFSDPSGDQHSADIFERWSPQELAAIGVKLFVENPIPEGYLGGVPEDVESETQITRTYPHMVIDATGNLYREKQTIYARLAYLDGARVRATSSVVLAQAKGVDPDPADVAKLNEYEAQATELRAQLRALDVANNPLP